jgi:hypothetical protein
MHVKTGVQSGSARKAPKDRAKIAESAIIIKTRKRAGEIFRDYYLENAHATVK